MKNLKLLRKNKNLTQKDIANMLQVAVSTVSAWENDVYQIDFDNLWKLADYFNVTIDELIGRAEIGYFVDARIAEEYSAEEKKLVENYRGLSKTGQAKVNGYIECLKSAPEYKNTTVSGGNLA